MKVRFHPEFPNDQRTFQAGYAEISAGLAARFQSETDAAIEAVKSAPSAAGHFVDTGSEIVPEFRRRNLNAFPCFILYGCTGTAVIFGAIIPGRSDPLSGLTRFPER
jgi:hypothetical protein